VPYTLIIHISNEEPVVGEVEELPAAVDNMLIVNNPRRLDGKDLPYLAEDAITVYWPISRINFIEVIFEQAEEDIIGFVRE